MNTQIIQLSNRSLDKNPAAVFLAGLAPNSRRVQRQALSSIAALLTSNTDALACDWSKVRFSHAQAVRSKLAEAYPPATVNRSLSALRGVLKTAWKLGQMSAETYHRAASVEGVRGSTLPAGRALSIGEITALMVACENDSGPAGVRDATIIAFMVGAGLRRDEVIKLDLSDYDPTTDALKVYGKGRKERLVYLVNGTSRALADWLVMRGFEHGPLFWPVNKSGVMTDRRLTNQAVYNLLVKRGKEAGVGDLSPHDLRRTFITLLLDAGADALTVAKLAGHSNVQTTLRYDRRGESTKKAASELLHVPYHGRY